MTRCLSGCTCGRHTSYTRTAEHRAAVGARCKGIPRRSVSDRFWEKVKKDAPDACWIWDGALYKQGYGKLYVGRNERGSSIFHRAHRISWELAHGQSVPHGLSVLHSCDNPPCVNPAHLRVGTDAENAADRVDRKRNREQRGEANSNAKITENQARQIIVELQRLPRRSQASIAAQFGIKQPQVSRIMRRESWGYLWDN